VEIVFDATPGFLQRAMGFARRRFQPRLCRASRRFEGMADLAGGFVEAARFVIWIFGHRVAGRLLEPGFDVSPRGLEHVMRLAAQVLETGLRRAAGPFDLAVHTGGIRGVALLRAGGGRVHRRSEERYNRQEVSHWKARCEESFLK